MLRRLQAALLLLASLVLLPGGAELVENVVHLVEAGHGAHALPDADHHADDPEHGCTGPVHICGCHISAPYAPSQGRGLATLLLPRNGVAPDPLTRPLLGFEQPPLRPPIA